MITDRKTRTDLQIRWMIRRDMPEVMEIERSCFEFAWTEEEYRSTLKERNVIGMVAENSRDQIVGAMVYELLKGELHLLNFAVHKLDQRTGVGRAMISKLINKLSEQRRNTLSAEVRETNLAAQLFFKQLGFTAVDIIRDHYEDTAEDAYQFVYSVNW